MKYLFMSLAVILAGCQSNTPETPLQSDYKVVAVSQHVKREPISKPPAVSLRPWYYDFPRDLKASKVVKITK
jgi:hypothetical protein